MHPLLASPFTLAGNSSLSPTICSSLDPCSSHGFSSLQSPSAFPSYDSSQQIEAFQPLSLDSAEVCCCHLQHCRREVSLDITQDESVSQSNLSEERPLLHHTDPQQLVCPFHSSSNKTLSQNCESLQKDLGLDCIARGSLFQESTSAGDSLPSYLSSLLDDSESSAFLPIQDGDDEKEQPVPDFQFPSSSPGPSKHSALQLTNDNNDIYSQNGYAFHSLIDNTRQFESFEPHSRINEIASIDARSWDSCYKSSLEGVSYELTSSIHYVPTLITRNGDTDGKENFIEAHINGSRVRREQLLDNVTPLCSVESKLDHIREAKNEALQEVHECKKAMYFSCKEKFMHANADDEASKENISPHVFIETEKKFGGVKTDSSGWMCPKDAKKKFKPKPRQLLLDKWLARQR